MSDVPARPASRQVAAFLGKLRSMPALRASGQAGRLIFALDATASREPLWADAQRLQAGMFAAAEAVGRLEIQLAWYSGLDDFAASPFEARPDALRARMRAVACAAGETQIERVLAHAVAETRQRKVNALVFVGDAMEESIDRLAQRAGELRLLGTPCFMFLEGADPTARAAFERVARLSGGAFAPFDAGSARVLGDLLAAVAAFAAGGRTALADLSRQRGGQVALLADQMARHRGG